MYETLITVETDDLTLACNLRHQSALKIDLTESIKANSSMVPMLLYRGLCTSDHELIWKDEREVYINCSVHISQTEAEAGFILLMAGDM